jgi:hypothetical protein
MKDKDIKLQEIKKHNPSLYADVVDGKVGLRNEIVDIWDTGSPPIIGKSKESIIKSFRKLKSYPIDNLLVSLQNIWDKKS